MGQEATDVEKLVENIPNKGQIRLTQEIQNKLNNYRYKRIQLIYI